MKTYLSSKTYTKLNIVTTEEGLPDTAGDA